MPPNQEARTALDKSGFGDLVHRDVYIRSRILTGNASVVYNDYYFTDGTTPTHLAGEYVTYDSETKEAAYHVFAKGAGAETTLNTANVATALLSATVPKTTLRSSTVEMANQFRVLGAATMADVTMTSLTTNTLKPLGAGTTPLLVETTGPVTFSSRQLNLDGNANTRIQFQDTSKLSLYAAGARLLDLDGASQNIGISTANPSHKLDVTGDTNVSSGNVYRVGGTSVLSNTTLGTGVTISSLTSVGTLGRLTVDPSGEVNVGNVTHRTFTRNLGTTLGDAVDICSIRGSAFILQLAVVQNQTSNVLGKYFLATVYFDNTDGAWRRMLPLTHTGDFSGNDFAVEISVGVNEETQSNTASFRLLRTGAGAGVSSNNIACHFTVHNSGTTNSITFTDLSGNSALVGQPLTNGVYRETLLTQSKGNVGVALQNATYPLDVSGDINVDTLYRVGGTPVLSGTTLGSGVTVSSLTSVGTLGSLAVNGNVLVNGNTFAVDAAANRVGVLTTAPAFPLDVGGNVNLSAGNVYRIGGTSVLSGTALGTTVTSSSLTSVGTLGSLTVTGEARFGHSFQRSFARSLGTTLGDAVDLCAIGGTTFYFQLSVIQNETVSNAITKVYVGSVSTQNADGSWRRMLPFTSTGDASGNDFGVEIQVSNLDTTTFRLLRTGVGSGTSAQNLTCHLTVHQNGVNGVTLTDLSGNAALAGQSLASAVFSQTLVTQSRGNVGISRQNAIYPVDVGGDTNVGTGNVYRVGNASVLTSSTLGSGVTVSSLTSVGTLGSLAVSGNVIVDTNTFAVDTVANRVGVLTTAPQFPLDVAGDANLGTGNVYRIGGTSVLSSTALGTTVTVSSLTSVGNLGSLTVLYDANIDSNTLRVDSKYAHVGVGKEDPMRALDVSGSSIISGNLNVMGIADTFTAASYSWTSRTSAADNNWGSITYGNGLFVAVAWSGTGNRVMTSPDGITWTSRTSAADNSWNGVTWGNGLFVAVATSGTGNRVMTSPDGITWTSRTSAADNAWRSVTWGNGLFVAVADSGTGNRVMTSPDGITWTARSSAADNRWYSVTYGNGLFVAVARNGTGDRVMTSPDGITWTSRTSAGERDWRSVTWGNGLFVAVSSDGTGNRVMTSPDGITWTARSSAADNSWQSVTYGNGLFVAVSRSGSGNRVMTSPDGINWSTRSSAVDNSWLSVAWGNGRFVAAASSGSGNRVMTWDAPTIDNYAWRGRVSAAGIGWVSVAWGNGLFVAVAYDSTISTNRVMTSPDGITWTLRTNPDNRWTSVTWGNGLFVAVADSTGNRVMTSPDGITWTSRTAPANEWTSVTWGNGLFVAVASSGTGNRVMTSPDGITWTARTSATDNNWRSVTWGNNLFVAVADSGTGNRVMTSPDGITWTSRTSAADNSWRSVTWGNGLFVAVAESGTGNRVMTSPNGITWTARTSAADNGWRSVTWGNGLFVAVALSGTGNRVMTSPDGITWMARSSAADNSWIGIAYGNGRFVAVSWDGIGNPLMTWDVPTKNMVYYNADTGLLSRGDFDVPSARVSGNLTVLESANVSGPVTAASLAVSGNVQVNGNTFIVNATQNRVGILTTAPQHALDIAGDLNLATGNIYQIGNTSVLSSSALGTTVTVSSLTSVGTLGNLVIANNLTVDTSTLRVDAANNRVGVSTATPQYPLDVSGNVNTDTSYLIGGTPVISSTSLGTTIASAPGLTSIGTLSSLAVSGTFTSQSNVNFTGATASFTVAGPSTFNNDLTVSGNLTVNGSTTYFNTATLQIDDKNVEFGIDTADLPTLNGGGITLGSIGIGTARPLLEYTYDSGADYWKSNIGVRGVGSTTYSAFDKEGLLKIARNDGTGDYVHISHETINFSQKWRLNCDTSNNKLLLEHYESGDWVTKFSFA